MDDLQLIQNFYDEHAEQARQHENQRERMTSIIPGVAGLLVGLVTFSKLAIWSKFAAVTVSILGVYGYLFAGKHYERNRLHTQIMKAVRSEMEEIHRDPDKQCRPLSELRNYGREEHYKEFRWPREGEDRRLACQANAKSWIARQHLHPFWEAIHIILVFVGLFLAAMIFATWLSPTQQQLMKVEIIKAE